MKKKKKVMTTPNAGKDAEKLDPLFAGTQNAKSILENSLAISLKTKYIVIQKLYS